MTPFPLQHTRINDKDIISYLPKVYGAGEVPRGRCGRLRQTKTVLKHRPVLMGLPRILIFSRALSLPHKANSRELGNIHPSDFFHCGFVLSGKYMASSLNKERILPAGSDKSPSCNGRFEIRTPLRRKDTGDITPLSHVISANCCSCESVQSYHIARYSPCTNYVKSLLRILCYVLVSFLSDMTYHMTPFASLGRNGIRGVEESC